MCAAEGNSSATSPLPLAPSPSRPLSLPPRRRVAVSLCLIALLASMIAIIRPAAIAPTGKLAIHFLDVGQGDSAFIVFPRGTTMLVDAGGELQIGRVINHTKSNEATTVSQQSAEAMANGQARDEDGDTDEAPVNDDGFAIGEAVVSRFLWSQRRTRLDYALATHADDVVAQLSAPARRLTQRIFRQLVTPERTRAIVELADLHALSTDSAEISRLIGQLVDARLLVVQTRGDAGGGSVELVHESLT